MTKDEQNEILNKANTPENKLNLEYMQNAIKVLVQAVEDVRNQTKDAETNLYMVMNLISMDESLGEDYARIRSAITECFLKDKFTLKKY